MNVTRRTAIMAGTAALATVHAPVGFGVSALAQDAANTIPTEMGNLTIHPVSHASLVLEGPDTVIYADPVGEASAYEGLPQPDLILITHEHGDHYSPETLSALVGENTPIITNPAVYDMLPDDLRARATALANGESTNAAGVPIEAIPAYNTTEDRLQYHPEGRDNGYVLTIGEARVYIAGDTEDIPEMRALQNIDLAFVPMNLPYTMTVDQAASAVAEFVPSVVYPYHHRGSDVEQFRSQVEEAADGVEVRLSGWYEDA